jgi:carbon-monoxide dehydrogenase medium subunit
MKMRLSQPEALIDIARLPELSGIREKDGKIEIGAGTVHHEVATSSVIVQRCPMLSETAASIGDPQVRNRGTLGGSIAHADPSADYPAALLALDAEVLVRGGNGSRVVRSHDFFRGLFTVDLAADEIIVSIQFTPVRSAAYAKLYQRASHFAIVGVAAALDAGDGVIRAARIGLTGAGPYATRLSGVESALVGKPLSMSSVKAAIGGAGSGIDEVNSDIHASAEYRRAMIPVFTERALARALARHGQG